MCSSQFNDKSELIEHYINYHNIDRNNYFFNCLINVKNKPHLEKCICCDKFLVTKKKKAQHDFLNAIIQAKRFLLKKNRLKL